jgi:hypothetical protein
MSADGWINKRSYVHIINQYSALKRNKMLTDICYNIAKTWKYYAEQSKVRHKMTNIVMVPLT